jgi:hypothetical protein
MQQLRQPFLNFVWQDTAFSLESVAEIDDRNKAGELKKATTALGTKEPPTEVSFRVTKIPSNTSRPSTRRF